MSVLLFSLFCISVLLFSLFCISVLLSSLCCISVLLFHETFECTFFLLLPLQWSAINVDADEVEV